MRVHFCGGWPDDVVMAAAMTDHEGPGPGPSWLTTLGTAVDFCCCHVGYILSLFQFCFCYSCSMDPHGSIVICVILSKSVD